MTFDAAMKEKEKFTPAQGFNVVGVDNFGTPGDALYLVGNFESEQEAQTAIDERQPGSEDKFYIYPAR